VCRCGGGGRNPTCSCSRRLRKPCSRRGCPSGRASLASSAGPPSDPPHPHTRVQSVTHTHTHTRRTRTDSRTDSDSQGSPNGRDGIGRVRAVCVCGCGAGAWTGAPRAPSRTPRLTAGVQESHGEPLYGAQFSPFDPSGRVVAAVGARHVRLPGPVPDPCSPQSRTDRGDGGLGGCAVVAGDRVSVRLGPAADGPPSLPRRQCACRVAARAPLTDPPVCLCGWWRWQKEEKLYTCAWLASPEGAAGSDGRRGGAWLAFAGELGLIRIVDTARYHHVAVRTPPPPPLCSILPHVC
jgi:hypothetical protein